MGLVSGRRLSLVDSRGSKHDKSIYVACIGWIILDAAIVIGIIVRQ
jgi:hypothetical protein